MFGSEANLGGLSRAASLFKEYVRDRRKEELKTAFVETPLVAAGASRENICRYKHSEKVILSSGYLTQAFFLFLSLDSDTLYLSSR